MPRGKLITRAVGLMFLLAFASLAFGQGIITGSIAGSVTDPTAAVIPGANVAAKNQETNQIFSTTTNEAGIFVIANIPPGHYSLTVEAPNFAKAQVAGIEVVVAKQAQVNDIRLQVSAASAVVEVSGAAPLVETGSAQVANTVDSKAVSDLPIGRGLDQLTLYMPGISTAGSVGRGNNNGALFSVNGQRPRSNNFEIDGQGINDTSVTGPSIFLENNDLVAEYQVLTNYDAAYGRNTGSQVNVITKNGGNAFHGTVFETWRGSTFDSLTNQEENTIFGFCGPGQTPAANGCTQPQVAREVENFFGGTIGGPIRKDKLWFFASAIWDRDRTSGSPITSSSGQVTPTVNGVNQLAAAFPSSPGVGFLKAFGPALVPGSTPTFSGIVTRTVTVGATSVPVEFGVPSRTFTSPSNIRQFSGRGDWQVTSKDRFFVRYLIDDEITSNTDAFLTGVSGFVVDVPSRGQQISGDWTRQFTNTFINQARFNWTRLRTSFGGGTTGCTTQDPSKCPLNIVFGDTTLLGSPFPFGLGVPTNAPQGRQNEYWQIQDNATKVMGRHQLKWGGEFTSQESPSSFLPNFNGAYTFPTFNDFIANTPSSVAMADGSFTDTYREKDVAFYFQDDWRIANKLTLNLGLRWEWFQQGVNLLHDLSVAQQTGSTPFWDTSLPLSRTTFPAIPQNYHNFGPVFGFAWSPISKTVLRGGFRIAYDTTFYNIFLNSQTNAPVVNSGTLTSGIDPVVPGLPTSGFTGADARTLVLPFLPRGVDPGKRAQTLVSPNLHNPYSEQWSFGVEREIGSRMAAEIRYLGNHSVGLYENVNGNPALNALIKRGFASLIPAGLTPCTTAGMPGNVSGDKGGFVDCTKRNVLVRTNNGYSMYNALQSRLSVRSFHGFTGNLAYTWAHAIDNASDVFATTSAGMLSFPQNPFDPTVAEKGNSNFDYRHTVGLALIYELPLYRSQQGFLGKLLGGWQPNVTYRYNTGQPFTVIETKTPSLGTLLSLCDASNDFSPSTDACRPILNNAAAPFNSVGIITALVGGVPTIRDRATGSTALPLSAYHWLANNINAAKFLGTPFGGVGRNTLNGQPTHAVNFAMQKNTKLNERLTLQLRVTAFNVLNHQFLGLPGNSIGNAATSFGNFKFNAAGGSNKNIVESGIGRRRLEFTGKIVF